MSFLIHIKMLALDVDGVMTDGIIYYSPSGDAMKGFSARDGMGISLIRAAGIQTALVTGRRSPMVEQRAKDLHIDYVLQDCSRKLLAMQQLCSEIGLSLDEVAYMGDDLNDVFAVEPGVSTDERLIRHDLHDAEFMGVRSGFGRGDRGGEPVQPFEVIGGHHWKLH